MHGINSNAVPFFSLDLVAEDARLRKMVIQGYPALGQSIPFTKFGTPEDRPLLSAHLAWRLFMRPSVHAWDPEDVVWLWLDYPIPWPPVDSLQIVWMLLGRWGPLLRRDPFHLHMLAWEGPTHFIAYGWVDIAILARALNPPSPRVAGAILEHRAFSVSHIHWHRDELPPTPPPAARRVPWVPACAHPLLRLTCTPEEWVHWVLPYIYGPPYCHVRNLVCVTDPAPIAGTTFEDRDPRQVAVVWWSTPTVVGILGVHGVAMSESDSRRSWIDSTYNPILASLWHPWISSVPHHMDAVEPLGPALLPTLETAAILCAQHAEPVAGPNHPPPPRYITPTEAELLIRNIAVSADTLDVLQPIPPPPEPNHGVAKPQPPKRRRTTTDSGIPLPTRFIAKAAPPPPEPLITTLPPPTPPLPTSVQACSLVAAGLVPLSQMPVDWLCPTLVRRVLDPLIHLAALYRIAMIPDALGCIPRLRGLLDRDTPPPISGPARGPATPFVEMGIDCALAYLRGPEYFRPPETGNATPHWPVRMEALGGLGPDVLLLGETQVHIRFTRTHHHPPLPQQRRPMHRGFVHLHMDDVWTMRAPLRGSGSSSPAWRLPTIILWAIWRRMHGRGGVGGTWMLPATTAIPGPCPTWELTVNDLAFHDLQQTIRTETTAGHGGVLALEIASNARAVFVQDPASNARVTLVEPPDLVRVSTNGALRIPDLLEFVRRTGPPCIRGLLERLFALKSHPKDTDRFVLMSWLADMGLGEDAIEEACASTLYDRAPAERTPSVWHGIRRSHDAVVASAAAKGASCWGCSKLAGKGYCPLASAATTVTDIEDSVDMRAVVKACSQEARMDQKWDGVKRGTYWGPVAAVASRLATLKAGVVVMDK